jgi:hypothetical protein
LIAIDSLHPEAATFGISSGSTTPPTQYTAFLKVNSTKTLKLRDRDSP